MSDDSFQGISVPEGDAAGLENAAAGFTAVAGQIAIAATQLQAMPAQVGSWQGQASVNHAAACLTNAGAARQAAAAVTEVTVAARRYAHRLHDAQERARRAIQDARDAQHRIDRAEADIADARGRATTAAARIDQAYHALAVSSAAGAPSPSAQSALDQAGRDAAQAATDERRAQRQLDEAKDDLADAKRRGHQADQDAHDAARAAAAAFAAGAESLPQWIVPGPPASATAAEKQDKPWWKEGLDQVGGFGKGVWDGVKGFGQAGAMLYRASPVNAVLDTGSFERQWDQLGQGAAYAWHNPGDFAKQVVNADDLEHGRIGHWLGNLAPDVALAFATGGTGTVVARGTKAAEAVEDTADVASTVRRVGGRLPRNARYAGKPYALPEDVAKAYPDGVMFRETGFPEFTPYSEADAASPKLTGDYGSDSRTANRLVGLPQTPEGWTWHHVEDGQTMELVPQDLHRAVPHTGGAAVIRAGERGQIPVVPAPPPPLGSDPFHWSRALATGGGAAGVTGATPALTGGGG